MTTNHKGDIGQIKVMVDLINRGFELFTPFSDHSAVDLIVADTRMCLKRLQIKYRSKTEKGILLPCVSVVNGKRILIDKSLIDGWAVFEPSLEMIYYINHQDVGNKFRLMIDPNNQLLTDPARLWI